MRREEQSQDFVKGNKTVMDLETSRAKLEKREAQK
jgi:hypothetical protein